MDKDLRIPDCYAARLLDGGWYIVDRRDGGKIMGPFRTREEVLDAYADDESREAQ